MLAVRHLDLQLLLQGQFKDFCAFHDQIVLYCRGYRRVLDVEEAYIDNCFFERLQEFWFCNWIVRQGKV